MNPSTAEMFATMLFAGAVLHTFLATYFQRWASRFPEGSIAENLLHLIGEIEVVFGLWAGILIVFLTVILGKEESISYVERLDFTEPLFVFAIMAIASTKPIVDLADRLIRIVSRILPLPKSVALYFSCLALGPLLGSFITEPAAMTVTAILLRQSFFKKDSSSFFKYVTLAALFVNVSIGGVLTPFAAPPVLMVAQKWNWDLSFMLMNFGWKAALAVLINGLLALITNYKELLLMSDVPLGINLQKKQSTSPLWLSLLESVFLVSVVAMAHHPVIFMGIFLFFLGVCTITQEYQEELKLRESLLVSFFLGGLVILGGLQKWWLQPLIQGLDNFSLFLGSTALTAITDNAALTYLGSQVDVISPSYQYALVSGAIAGGGLTVIANAPNPAGYSILRDSFGESGIQPFKLLFASLVPTGIAMALLWLA